MWEVVVGWGASPIPTVDDEEAGQVGMKCFSSPNSRRRMIPGWISQVRPEWLEWVYRNIDFVCRRASLLGRRV